jgi:hypothetical protein
MPARSAWLAQVVAEYDAQGWHRTGSATDDRSARWLADLARQTGAAVSVSKWGLSRLVHRRSNLRFGGAAVPGVPLYDSPLPPSEGLQGRLGLPGSGADITVVESTPGPSLDDPLEQVRREPVGRAVVAIMHGATPGLALRNAHSLDTFGPPVLQVASTCREALLQAASHREHATLVVEARRAPATASNVVATVRGSSEGGGEVVVLTPRSGWWHCAAERGGGIACWLQALKLLAARPERRGVRFVATSGHELGYAGLQAYLAETTLDPRATWIHLGANIGAADGRLGVVASDEELSRQAFTLLEGPGGCSPFELRTLPGAVGEASQLEGAGLPFVSFVGSSSRFHLPTDRFPDNVDVPRLTSISDAVTELVRVLAQRV